MSIQAIRKAVRKARTKQDDFDQGTVVRWTASGIYTYAAIKTPVGWFTTAREFNRFVPQTVCWEELLEILARPETTDIVVSHTWLPVETSGGSGTTDTTE
jgi:hypothetical protein